MFEFNVVKAETIVIPSGRSGRTRRNRAPQITTRMDEIVESAWRRRVKTELKAVEAEFQKSFGSDMAFNATIGVLRYTLERLAEGCTPEDAARPLSNGLCPVSAETMCNLSKSLAKKCRNEIADIKLLLLKSRVGARLHYVPYGDFWMPEPDEEDAFHDNDPVNGWRFCKKEAELAAEQELAESARDKEKAKQIRAQIVELNRQEAARGNPLALFSLGVRYFNAGGVEKNDVLAFKLLQAAERMGVRRASSLLFTYFGS